MGTAVHFCVFSAIFSVLMVLGYYELCSTHKLHFVFVEYFFTLWQILLKNPTNIKFGLSLKLEKILSCT